MKKKLALLLAATMVVTMVTAGCGSKSDDQKTAKKTETLRMDTKQMMVLM